MNKINFYLPNFQRDNGLNLTIIKTLRQHPEYFYNNIKIGAVYDCFYGAVWSGGKNFYGINTKSEIEEIIHMYNELNIPLRFTFTNSLLEKKHLYDTYCNLIMESANNGLNEVLVNSPILEEYLRKEYPNFKIISSTTKCERDINKINKENNKYFLTVIDYNDNHNWELLNKIKQKDKIELLVNAYCPPNCPNRKAHYDDVSKAQLIFQPNYTNFECNKSTGNFSTIKTYENFISQEELYGKYFLKGFCHFKIEGRRVHLANVIESYIYYLIKPEYKNEFRNELLVNCWEY